MSNGNSGKIGYNNLRSKSHDKAQGYPENRNNNRGRMMQNNTYQRDSSQGIRYDGYER